MAWYRMALEDGGKQANSKDPPCSDDNNNNDKKQGRETKSPAESSRRMKIYDGLSSLERETRHFVEITAMHGVRRIWVAQGWSKAFWCIMFVLMAGMLVWQCLVVVQAFTSQPTKSEISYKIAEQGLKFPKITICNRNPIKQSFVKSINKTGDLSPQLLRYILMTNNDVLSTFSVNEQILERDEELYRQYKMDHPEFDIRSFYTDGGFACEDVVKMCSFAGRRFKCCEPPYAMSVLTSLGLCQVLNLQASGQKWMHRQTDSSEDAGLQVVLDAQVEEKITLGGPPETFVISQLENGFRFYIDEPETGTYVSSQGISASPGDVTYSAITLNTYELLDRDNWGVCQHHWPMNYTGHNTLLKYQQEDCISKCKAQFFNESCGCSPFVYDIDSEYETCTPLQTYDCLSSHIVRNETSGEFVWPECIECAPECNRSEFVALNSYGRGFGEDTVQSLTSFLGSGGADHIRKNFLALSIFFREMSFTAYEQKKDSTITNVISGIGGMTGLFLGCSVLTLIEALIFFLKVGWMSISSKRRRYEAERERHCKREQEETTDALQSIRNLSVFDLVSAAELKRDDRSEVQIAMPEDEGRRKNEAAKAIVKDSMEHMKQNLKRYSSPPPSQEDPPPTSRPTFHILT